MNKQKMTDENGKVITTNEGIANLFNNHFGNVGIKLASKLKNKKEDSNYIKMIQDSIFLNPTDENEIMNIINNLKDSTSPGYDKISPKIIKIIRDIVAKPMSHIINTSFINGHFPKCYKKAITIPIYKDGKKDIASNYRPISLITCCAKIFEKTLKTRMLQFLNEHNIINKKQFGFRQNQSTEDALTEFTNIIYNNIDKKTPTAAVFIDLAKAFDTLDHTILLKKTLPLWF